MICHFAEFAFYTQEKKKKNENETNLDRNT